MTTDSFSIEAPVSTGEPFRLEFPRNIFQFIIVVDGAVSVIPVLTEIPTTSLTGKAAVNSGDTLELLETGSKFVLIRSTGAASAVRLWVTY